MSRNPPKWILLLFAVVALGQQLRLSGILESDPRLRHKSDGNSIEAGSDPQHDLRNYPVILPSYTTDRLVYTDTSIYTDTSKYKPLLSVPFYVYTDVPWNEATMDNQSIHSFMNNPPRNPKHSDDYWFFVSALRHPMRVLDPHQAQLFVVAAFWNTHMENLFYKTEMCVNQTCNAQLFRWTNQRLGQSPHFQRSTGRNHILVTSHFKKSKNIPESFRTNLDRCNRISFEDVPHPYNGIQFPSWYVGRTCHPIVLQNEKTDDFVFVGKLKGNYTRAPVFRMRTDVCAWFQCQPNSYRVSVCGYGKQCPALTQAKYGFHFPGDTLGANRLIDTILSATVPVFTDLALSCGLTKC